MILDVDGTLVDSNDAHARAWVEGFAVHGIAVAFERVRLAIGMGGDKLMPAVADIAAESPRGKSISKRRGEIFKERFLPTLRAFPGVRELVLRFSNDGFTLAVASSATKDELTHSSRDRRRGRSDPDDNLVGRRGELQAGSGYRGGRLEADGMRPGSAVMLGDTPYDVEAALGAGIRIVGLECGGWGKADLAGASEVYVDPAGLLARYDTSLFARVRAATRSSA